MIDNTINDDKTIVGGDSVATENAEEDMVMKAFQRQMKPAVLAVMTSVAALTGMGAGQMPRNTQRAPQRAPAVQRVKTSSAQVKKAPNPKVQRASKGAPVVQTGNVSPVPAKKVIPVAMEHKPASSISIPDMPELKFSNKFANYPIPQVANAEYYIQRKYESDRSKYNSSEATKCHDGVILREVSPYIPDIFYEKSKLPYAERIKFLNSPEKKKIMKALQERFETNIGKKIIWGRTEYLMPHFLRFCDEVLIFGRPLVSLTTETESVREAVDLCGMTQLGFWMDIQKAKRRGLEYTVPNGYDEKMAQEQVKYAGHFGLLYPNKWEVAVGKWVEKPIRDDLRNFSEEDFAHLTVEEKEELLDLFNCMPHEPKFAPDWGTGKIYQIYSEMQADKTGYRYIQEKRPRLSQEKARKVQQLAMEMVIYRRPLALLRAEDYTLEQVIQVCQFKYAEKFYHWQQRGSKNLRKTSEMAVTMINLQANALKTLGQRFNHPDWVEFGQEMYDIGQKCEVAKHDDSQMIQNQVAKVSDAPRVRNPDGSTNATSRINRDAGKGAN